MFYTVFFFRRGQKSNYDLWAAQGPEYKIWDYDHCLEGQYYIQYNILYYSCNLITFILKQKAFKATENNARENPDKEFKKYHGFNGLLHVQDSNDNYDITKDVAKVTKNLGIPYNNDFNGARQNGIGKFQVSKYLKK